MDRLRRAQLRVWAKEFRASIPDNMASKLPENILDKLQDDEVEEFYAILRSLRLERQPFRTYWEKH